MLVISRHIFTCLLDLVLETTACSQRRVLTSSSNLSASPWLVLTSRSSGLSFNPKVGAQQLTKKIAVRGGILLSINQLCGKYSHAVDTKTITSRIQLLKNLKDKGLQLLLV